MLMEWAIGKGYDLYSPNTGKLLMPGSQISWDVHIHAVGEEITDHTELGVWLYPKGQEPKYRHRTTAFLGNNRARSRYPARIRIKARDNYSVLKQAARF